MLVSMDAMPGLQTSLAAAQAEMQSSVTGAGGIDGVEPVMPQLIADPFFLSRFCNPDSQQKTNKPDVMPDNNTYLEHADKIEQALRTVPVGHPLRDLLETSARLLTHAGETRSEDTDHDNTRVALIDRGYHWRPVTNRTPRGSKVQLVNRRYGVAAYGTISSHERYFDFWAPLPTFRD